MPLTLILWIIFQGRHVQSILKYDITKGKNLDDIEPVNTVKIPQDKSQFVSFDKDSRYMGLLFAGKSEFSWIVNLRVHNTEPESWSIGNIISPKNILTTCRAVRLLQGLRGEVEITFFQMYLWEHLNYEEYVLIPNKTGGEAIAKKEWKLGGVRRVAKYNVHPRCDQGNNRKTLSFDVGIVELTKPIDLALPFIGYTPILRDPVDPGSIPNEPFGTLKKQRKICLVGSIGRNYVNWKYHMVEDYKVRFRVYAEEWEVCEGMMDKICDKTVHDCGQMGRNVRGGRDWTCMRTRARVGTVCDHDRGAPLVCDGEVVGLVVFGALWDYCNNRFPMPFVVAKLYQFKDFLHGNTLDVRTGDFR